MGLFGGGGTQKVKQVIPDYAKGTLWNVGGQTNDLLRDPALSGQQQQALDRGYNLAMGQQSPFLNGGQNFLTQLYQQGGMDPRQRAFADQLTSGQFVNPAMQETQRIAMGGDMGNNPFLQANFNKAAQGVTDQLTKVTVPGMDRNFAAQGRLGSTAYANSRNTAEDVTARSLGDLATGIYSNAYQTDQANRMSALGQLGNLGQQNIQNRMAGANMYQQGVQNQMQGIGASQIAQGLRYDDVNRAYQYATQQQQAPWQRLLQASQIGGTLAGTGTGTAGTTSTSTGSDLMGLLGTGLMAGAIFASDRRLKDDIRRVGTTEGGVPVHTFRYRTDPPGTLRLGYVAQEVAELQPEAVLEDSQGYLAVNHAKVR